MSDTSEPVEAIKRPPGQPGPNSCALQLLATLPSYALACTRQASPSFPLSEARTARGRPSSSLRLLARLYERPFEMAAINYTRPCLSSPREARMIARQRGGKIHPRQRGEARTRLPCKSKRRRPDRPAARTICSGGSPPGAATHFCVRPLIALGTCVSDPLKGPCNIFSKSETLAERSQLTHSVLRLVGRRVPQPEITACSTPIR